MEIPNDYYLVKTTVYGNNTKESLHTLVNKNKF